MPDAMCSDERHRSAQPVRTILNPDSKPLSTVDAISAEPAGPFGGRRWLICGLLLFAATVNYMDRQVIALLKPTLQVQFGWTEVGYSNIVLAFQLAYAIGLLFV